MPVLQHNYGCTGSMGMGVNVAQTIIYCLQMPLAFAFNPQILGNIILCAFRRGYKNIPKDIFMPMGIF
jgi:hypothetical protein